MQPLISIIIPVYNAEAWVVRCILSAKNQNYTNIEIIIIDDGSSDNSGLICENYAKQDNRIIVFHQNNQGVSSARNNGINKSNGEWIVFIDADDYIDNDYISSLYLCSDNSQIVISGYRKINNDTCIYKKRFRNLTLHETSDIDLWDEILVFGTPWGKLFESSLIKGNKIKFPESMQLHEDHLFYFSAILKANKINVIDYIGYNYVDSGQISLSRKPNIPLNLKLSAYNKLDSFLNDIVKIKKLPRQQLYETNNFIIRLLIAAITISYLHENKTLCDPISPTKKERNFIKQYHRPKSIKGYILKMILVYVPSIIQHSLLKKLVK